MILFYSVLIVFLLFGMAGFLLPVAMGKSDTKAKIFCIVSGCVFAAIVLTLYSKHGSLDKLDYYQDSKFVEQLLKQQSIRTVLAKFNKEKYKLKYLTALDPNNPVNFFELAKLYELQEDNSGAYYNFKQAFLLEPTNYTYCYSYLLINSKLNHGNMDKDILLKVENIKNSPIKYTVLALNNFAQDNYLKSLYYLHEAEKNYNITQEQVPFKLLLEKTKAMVADFIGKPVLDISVRMTDAVKNLITSNDVVFITAKSPGVNIPVAVKKLRVLDLASSVKLSVKNAMNPEWTLDNVDRVVVEARISKSGDAFAKEDDLRVKSSVIDTKRDSAIKVQLQLDLS